MVLVLILLGIFIFILLVTLTILFSTVQIEIKELEIDNMHERQFDKKEKNIKKYEIIVSLKLLHKLTYLKLHFSQDKIKKMITKIHLEKIDIQKIEKRFKLEDIKQFKKLHLHVTHFHLDAKLGFQEPLVTVYAIATIAAIFSNILARTVKNCNPKNYYYQIEPVYQNNFIYKIQFDCIIQTKLVHIINVIYIFLKKGRSDKNEQSTSNRRSYGYSYE